MSENETRVPASETPGSSLTPVAPAAPVSSSRSSSRMSSQRRTCLRCQQPISGQYVHALGSIFHYNCFVCEDCGKPVAEKFFPIDKHMSGSVFRQSLSSMKSYAGVLCETDRFRRLDMLCAKCGSAIRDSYITAAGQKYHVDHFTCQMCPTVLGPRDCYYLHEDQTYCSFHYAALYATRCKGCSLAILKDFVEVFRDGKKTCWHLPCHLTYKHWHVSYYGYFKKQICSPSSISAVYDDGQRERIEERDKQLHTTIIHVWLVMSQFEEQMALCLGDMLASFSKRNVTAIILSTQFLVSLVKPLFKAIITVDSALQSFNLPSADCARDARSLCKRIVAFLLHASERTNLHAFPDTSPNKDPLSIITNVAYLLKHLIHTSLSAALRLTFNLSSSDTLDTFLSIFENETPTGPRVNSKTVDRSMAMSMVEQRSNLCPVCEKPVEEKCVSWRSVHIHLCCMRCAVCGKNLDNDFCNATYNLELQRVECAKCAQGEVLEGFQLVKQYEQFVYLLSIALSRFILSAREAHVFHTDEDVISEFQKSQTSLLAYKTNVNSSKSSPTPDLMLNGTMIDNYHSYADKVKSFYYNKSLPFISDDERSVVSFFSDAESRTTSQSSFRSRWRGRKSHSHKLSVTPTTHEGFLFTDAQLFTLDDICLAILDQRNRENRPNAFQHAKNIGISHQSMYKKQIVQSYKSIKNGDDSLERKNDYLLIDNLSDEQNALLRRLCLYTLHRKSNTFRSLKIPDANIEVREASKPLSFWQRIRNWWRPSPKMQTNGLFGIPLTALVQETGVYSTLGLTSSNSRIPLFIENLLRALLSMDMSVEGIFRKNGNLKELRLLVRVCEKQHGDVGFENQTPVQLAALLKKFLRELPEPLLTFDLFQAFIDAANIEDNAERLEVLHMLYCLLPKEHHDTTDVLFGFFGWVASFSRLSEDTGSKMDLHNLATVISPNILYSKGEMSVDDSFLAIEVVRMLLEYHTTFESIPSQFVPFLYDEKILNSFMELSPSQFENKLNSLVS
ncbi:rho-type GTPase-activating protein [Schizosaccharomyces japonicus yFS275]|uniref:Rho-type GTPase-activating protein n=1 Tax=Schizosaccharomyces japonicus (strain yFS275 / FY16936) TaxID=402676 RepID=B6JVY6_SCHJY|nr:rho-type GTPase-activating protein [Schizosaccharomyces japonicus yFS275]EEB05537.1 rho-type GTPase-activating protein [Schizosaccharomyces japonicus yFS275]